MGASVQGRKKPERNPRPATPDLVAHTLAELEAIPAGRPVTVDEVRRAWNTLRRLHAQPASTRRQKALRLRAKHVCDALADAARPASLAVKREIERQRGLPLERRRPKPIEFGGKLGGLQDTRTRGATKRQGPADGVRVVVGGGQPGSGRRA